MNNELPQRKSIRLKTYDYSQTGWYYITICTNNREETLGRIPEPGKMILNKKGEIALKYWEEIIEHYENVKLDIFIIMPNHIHGIIEINNNNVGAIHELPASSAINEPFTHDEQIKDISSRIGQNNRKISRKMLIPKIIGRFKMQSAKQINLLRNTQGQPVWQRNYYEHIITSDKAHNNIREYIENNPYNWDDDRNNI